MREDLLRIQQSVGTEVKKVAHRMRLNQSPQNSHPVNTNIVGAKCDRTFSFANLLYI